MNNLALSVRASSSEAMPLVIGAQSVSVTDWRKVYDPATGDMIGLAPVSARAHLDDAVACAREAFDTWSKASDAERRDACRRMAAALTAHAGELAELLSREQGKPLAGLNAQFELGGCAAWMGYAAELDLPIKIIQDDAAARVEQHRTPIGVVGSITPWNWPLLIAVWHIAPAIRVGNTVVIKPSPHTTLSTLRMVQLLAAELPPGVLNIVSDGEDIGAAMAAHEGIDKIAFTGSTRTGKAIMAAAAPTLKKLTLELGGNDAGIVLADADPQAIADGLFWGAFINNGQTCAALKRLYVHDDIYDAVCDALVAVSRAVPMGPGLEPGNLLGPLQNRAQFDIVSGLADAARRDGARILTGGKPGEVGGLFYPVTLIADATEGMACVAQEQFGPLLPIIRYTDVDDAVRQANALDTDLAASVWSPDLAKARAVADRLVAGTVYINKHGEIAPHIPFGGARWSSVGVGFGQEGLEEFTNIKIYNFAK